jgi:hypothetical protein
LAVTQLPEITLSSSSSLAGTISAASSLAITQLPQITLGVSELPEIKLRFGMDPTRIHFPTNMKFSLCVLGTELLSLSTCGESMIIIEDYHPHERERCR